MLSRIMNYLLSGTDLPERFQIPVLYRNSFALSIGILHKFNPSNFNSTAVRPDVSGTFSHLARSPAANGIFARVHILAPRAVAYGTPHLRTSAHKKRQSMPTIHVLPPFYPIIYVIFSVHLPGSYLSFEAPATSPLSARSARTFGMTISPLKKSAKDHTSSSFRQEPITMQTTTISE